MTHTSTEPRNKLLPCPFCGARARFEIDDERWEWVECSGCGIQGNRSASLMEDCKPKLAEAWNRRAQVVPKGWKLVPEEPTPAMYDRVMREGYYHDDPKAVKAVLRAEYQDMLAAAPQPPESAQLDDINVADMAQAVDSKEAAPVQMPEPVAVAFRFETEEYGSTATSFYPSDRIGMGWTALYTEHQVRQLLAAHAHGITQAKQGATNA